MYGIVEKEPFQVYARREGSGSDALIIRFECHDGMGILGIRKVGRQDPAPASAYEEDDVDPESLRAGRFVHVLNTGQRQSYALSRISPDIAGRLPADAWVELKPQSEYGFRYLVVPEEALVGAAAPVQVAVASAPSATPASTTPTGAPDVRPAASSALPPAQTPVAPPLARAALASLGKDQALEYLKTEMAKVDALQHRVAELEAALEKSRSRERDLLDVLARWQQH